MRIIEDLTIKEIEDIMLTFDEKPFRAKQIYNGIYQGKSISEMTDISNQLKEKLLTLFYDKSVEVIKELVSVDGTKKFLFKLYDDNIIEGVLMSYKYGNTICLSTQVGCRMGCAFCASGIGGLVRNLSAGEILSQVLLVNKMLGGTIKDRKITNIVLMGSGEPLDNYDNVIKFLRLVSDKNGINISPRNISLSTSGLVDKMYSLANENLPVNLTLSLHNPFDSERQKIMPVAKAYSVKQLVDALDNYFEKTGRRYHIEYSLIKGQNDTIECAKELKRLFFNKPCHINLIRLNSVKEKNLIGSTDKDAYKFMELLNSYGLNATLRRRMGDDIDGACGQLRRKFLSEEN